MILEELELNSSPVADICSTHYKHLVTVVVFQLL